MEEIKNRLFAMQDEKYKAFNSKLLPTVDPASMIGIRVPNMRAYAKELSAELKNEPGGRVRAFLDSLPHCYFEENGLHGALIEGFKDFETCMTETERFLPYIDNWATCDGFSPKVFAKHKDELLERIKVWIADYERPYIVRFAIGMLMQHFLDEDFKPEYLEMVALAEGSKVVRAAALGPRDGGGKTAIGKIDANEYYVNMERAWYFATALAKQWDAAVVYLEVARADKIEGGAYSNASPSNSAADSEKAAPKSVTIKKAKTGTKKAASPTPLDKWTHNKTIQKAVESYRISDEQKARLRELKLR